MFANEPGASDTSFHDEALMGLLLLSAGALHVYEYVLYMSWGVAHVRGAVLVHRLFDT